MPSYDLVSSMDISEMKNAINMANKVISGRYDFKGSKCSVDLKGESELEILGESEYQVTAARDILFTSMAKRGLSLKGLEAKDVAPTGKQMYKQEVIIHKGINKEIGKKINKIIKDSGFKVSSQYMDEKIRVTGKKIDDLREVYKALTDHKEVNIALSMENMK